MPIRIHCPSCHRALEMKDRLIGKSVHCPACGVGFVATAPADNPAPGPDAAAAAPAAQGPAANPLGKPGTIGRFQIRAALGQGGFGTVYRAYDPVLDREVAIKIPQMGAKAAQRLIYEARAAAPLRHPNIVAVYDAGADGDDLYIATEFVEGQTLAARIEQEAVDRRTATEWVKSLAEGLAYAHTERVIHRDVKPHNVMIGTSGRAQLMDFGLASSNATTENVVEGVAGTPAYMSPEQARGESDNIGPASDQYSLGAVLYELLTGEPPFKSEANTVQRIASGEVPQSPRALNPTVPRDLEAICTKAMSPDPAQRYPDCRVMAEDLNRWLNDELVIARRYSPLELLAYWGRKRPAVFGWTAAAVCLVALALGAGAAYGVNHISRSATGPSTAASSVLTTTATGATAAEPVGTKATTFNVSSRQHAETLLYGRLLDRTRLDYNRQDVLRADHWLSQTRWDFRDWEYNYLHRITTGGWKTIHGHSAEITAVAMHPDGRKFASAAADGSVSTWDIATGERQSSLQASQRVTSLTYSPDGKTLALATGAEASLPNMARGPASVAPLAVANGQALPGSDSSPKAPQEGAASPRYAVVLLKEDTFEHVGTYRDHTGSIETLAFSPDGKSIASGGPGPAAPTTQPGGPQGPLPGEIHLWDVSNLKRLRRLEAPTGAVRRLAFTRDGKRILASTGRGMFGKVLVWNLDPQATSPQADPAATGQQGIAPSPPVLPGATASLPPNVVPASSAVPSVASASATAADESKLFPEQQFAESYHDLVLHPQYELQITAAPAMETWLLEQGRRRVAGNTDLLARVMLQGEGTINAMQSVPSAIYDLDFAAEPGPIGQFTLAAAGGDALLRTRPGIVTLHDPRYEMGAQVPHLGHSAAVTAVAFRPDGKQFVSGSADGVLKIWNAEVHPEVVKLGPLRSAQRVAFGSDGRYVAVAERSRSWTEARGAITMWGPDGKPFAPTELPRGTVKVYDIQTGSEVVSLTAGPGNVLGLAMAPTMEWVAAGGEDAQVRVWDLATGQLRWEMPAPGIVRCLATTREGKYLAAACGAADPNASSSDSGTIAIWRTADGQRVASWQAHDLETLSVAFSPDGKQLASSGADRTVRLWDVATHKEVRSLESFDGHVVDLAFRPSGEDLAGAAYDPCRPELPGVAIVWSVSEGKRRLQLEGHAGWVYGVTYSANGKRLATGGGAAHGSLSQPGEVLVWDADTGIELLPLVGRPGRNEKTEQYTTTYKVHVPRLVTKEVPQTVTRKVPKVNADGETTYVEVSETVMTQVCELQTVAEERTKSAESHVQWEEPGAVLGVAFSGDGRALAAACEDGSALVWDAERCQPHDTVNWSDGRMACAAASPDGKWLATAGDAESTCDSLGLIRIYDAHTGRLARELETGAGPVTALAFSSDGQRLVSGSARGAAPVDSASSAIASGSNKENRSTVRAEVWDLTSGNRLSELVGHEQSITSIAVHPMDGRIVTAAGDGTVYFWAADTGEEIQHWSRLGPVTSVAFSPGGERLAIATASGKVWMSDADKGTFPKALASGLGHVAKVEFNADGKNLIALAGSVTGGGLETAASSKPSAQLALSRITTPPASELMVWEIAEPGKPRRLTMPQPARSVTWLGKTGRLAVTDHEGGNALIDPDSGVVELRLAGERGPGLAFAIGDDRLGSLSGDRQLHAWHTKSAVAHQDRCSECAAPRLKTIELERANPQTFLYKVRYSRDGQFAVVGGHVMRKAPPAVAHPVRIVDAVTGAATHTGGHYDVVRSVAVRPDGQQWASVGQDQNLYIWNPDGRSQTTPPHPNKLMKVIYSRDGRLIATATAFDGHAYLWDSNTLQEIRRFQVEPTTAFALAFDAEGKQLITGGLSGAIKVWDVATGTMVREWSAHEGTIHSIALSHNGKQLASCGEDAKVKLWDLEKGEQIRVFEGFSGPARNSAFSPDDSLLAVGVQDPVVRVFQVATGELAKELTAVGPAIESVAFSPDGAKLACCGRESSLVIWNWRTGEKLAANERAGECLAWSPDGRRLITGSVINLAPPKNEYDGIITLHDPTTGKLADTITLADVSRPEFDLSADSRYLAVGRQDGVAVVWDRKTGKIAAECRGHQGPIRGVAFHPQQMQFATAGQDGTVRFWSVSGEMLGELTHPGPVTCLAFSPMGEVFATGAGNRSAILWDVAERRQLHVFKGHYGEVCGLAFSADGQRIATTGRGFHNDRWVGDLKVWDVKTGERLLSVPSHTWWEAGLAFHPTLPHIASTGRDHKLDMFHAESGQLLLSLPTHGHVASSMVFSPDGTRLLALLGGSAKLVDATPEPRPFGNARAEPRPQEAAELAAARWVLEKGGQVQVLLDGVAAVDVNQIADLPADWFVVSRVVLTGTDTIGDADLEILKPLKHLVSVRLDLPKLSDAGVAFLADVTGLEEVFLNGTRLTDAGLATFSGLKKLRVLHVNDTSITGSGLVQLRTCVALENVELHRTPLDDAGLAPFAELPALTHLGIAGTKVTDEGIAKLKASKPNLNIGR